MLVYQRVSSNHTSSVAFHKDTLTKLNLHLHPGKWTWNLKITSSKDKQSFSKPSSWRFHLKFSPVCLISVLQKHHYFNTTSADKSHWKSVVKFDQQWTGSTITTLLHGKINPKDWQVLSLVMQGFSNFLGLFQVIMANPGESRLQLWGEGGEIHHVWCWYVARVTWWINGCGIGSGW